jgi:hypothetical protein
LQVQAQYVVNVKMSESLEEWQQKAASSSTSTRCRTLRAGVKVQEWQHILQPEAQYVANLKSSEWVEDRQTRLEAQAMVAKNDVYLNVEFFATLATTKRLLSFGMFASVVSAELVQAYEGLAARRAAGGDLLVVTRLQGGGEGRQRDRARDGAAAVHAVGTRVVRLVVHLHSLRVFEGLVAPDLTAAEGTTILNEVHGHFRRLDVVVRGLGRRRVS